MPVIMIVVSISRVAVVGDDTVRVAHPSVGKMRVIVMMLVNGQSRRGTVAEQLAVLCAGSHRLRRSGAADVPVEADHLVGRCHDDVEIVGDQQDAAVESIADVANQFVEGDLTAVVDSLHRFVQHKEVGAASNGAGQHGALKLATGEMPHLLPGKVPDAGARQRISDVGTGRFRGQSKEALDGEGQGPVDDDLLRHITDPQSADASGFAFVWPEDAESHLGGGGFPRTIGADQRDDLAALNIEVDTAHEPAPGALNARIFQGNKDFCRFHEAGCTNG